MLKTTLIRIFLCSTILSCQAYAFELGAPVTASALITRPNGLNFTNMASQPEFKKIVLMSVNLTPKEKLRFKKNFRVYNKLHASQGVGESSLPEKVTLGMNDVPVLDQGAHATGAMFAVTGALDALIKRGDYISQLCSLSLSKSLAKLGYTVSGWDKFTDSKLALQQIFSFGYVTKAEQLKKSCAGVYEYPLKEADNTGNELVLQDHFKLSKPLMGGSGYTIYDWVAILSPLERFRYEDGDQFIATSKAVMNKIKSEMARPDAAFELRVIVGVLLPIEFCHNGACARHNKDNDTWVLTDEILKKSEEGEGIKVAIHTMVVTGYDDNATAVDSAGKTYKGLLTLRNSWGSEVGDGGDYYMSYDTFSLLSDEVTEIFSVYE